MTSITSFELTGFNSFLPARVLDQLRARAEKDYGTDLININNKKFSIGDPDYFQWADEGLSCRSQGKAGSGGSKDDDPFGDVKEGMGYDDKGRSRQIRSTAREEAAEISRRVSQSLSYLQTNDNGSTPTASSASTPLHPSSSFVCGVGPSIPERYHLHSYVSPLKVRAIESELSVREAERKKVAEEQMQLNLEERESIRQETSQPSQVPHRKETKLPPLPPRRAQSQGSNTNNDSNSTSSTHPVGNDNDDDDDDDIPPPPPPSPPPPCDTNSKVDVEASPLPPPPPPPDSEDSENYQGGDEVDLIVRYSASKAKNFYLEYPVVATMQYGELLFVSA